ncbi:hypothetical protein LSCM1_07188 [Leishmania martiniquensis]|uniref:Uncharacterized protein n=1 Tax=Leishmania martiniquensis TaxID=1580590 RepID=A0A836H2N4_9TRYP|nr:hypothetical protein LSCM1_07188 [Leishmania martiniquensis]
MAQLTRDEVHAYAEAMIAAIRTPEFQERVRAAMSREPTPMDAEAVMIRYEEVQADHFTNHYTSDSGSVRAGGASVSAGRTPEASEGPAQEVGGMCLQTTSDAPKLDGVHIVEQLKKAASVYKEAETLRLITQLCLLIEAQVAALPATVPALRHLYNNSMHGAHTLSQAPAASAQAGGAGHSMPPVAGASPQVRQIMEMAMRTLSPKQREILERVQQEMMPGKTPSPEDMRDVVLIQRQLAAFAQTMQKFGQKPSGRSSVDDSAGSGAE